jgi:hypothetical protein
MGEIRKRKYFLNKQNNDHYRVMWFAGGLAALSSVIYPSISAFVSVYADDDQQGKTLSFSEDY